jgi:hypothetical protein
MAIWGTRTPLDEKNPSAKVKTVMGCHGFNIVLPLKKA